jgi:hypothetical protein
MKQFFILFISFFTAATIVRADNVTREIDVTTSFHSLEIGHDINVVLTESTDGKIQVTGEEKFTKAVLFDVKNGHMKILSKKGSLKNKVTVYLPVKNLRKLTINGASYVRSNGTLTSKHLQVVLGGEAKIEINNLGDIAFYADEAIDMQIKKWDTKQNCQ